MPDHLHLLIAGLTPTAHLPSFARLSRQRSAVAFGRLNRSRLWQPRFYERTLQASENIAAVAEYIAANPVRARLAATVDEWPFAGGRLLRSPAEIEFGPTAGRTRSQS